MILKKNNKYKFKSELLREPANPCPSEVITKLMEIRIIYHLVMNNKGHYKIAGY